MSWLKRMFDSRYRQARAAEGAGEWRRAAALWAEAGEPLLASEALVHLAERAARLEERLEAWHDALRWIPEDDTERRDDIERRMARAVLQDAQLRGAESAEEKRRLADAAARLERAGAPGDAADAWRILGRTEDQARCLEAAGEIDELEALLERTSQADARQGKLRRLLTEYEMALEYGARLEARAALREAAQVASEDRSVTELLRRLEGRLPAPSRVRLTIDGRRVAFVGRLPAVIGRSEADVVVRGTSVSRRHAEVALADGTLVLRDLDSRNGTLVRGLPIRGTIELGGPTEVGLGDDVRLTVAPHGSYLVLDVESGLDRGERVVVGEGELRADGLPAAIRFVEGWAVLAADPRTDLTLGERACALPVHLLVGDRLVVGGVSVEVVE
jgi:pSer/pThr/pTyr-binding forkhead associated (FHA) protein